MKHKLILGAVVLIVCLGQAAAQEPAATVDSLLVDAALLPAAVTDLTVSDKDNDHGHAIVLNWKPSVDDLADTTGAGTVIGYTVYRWVPFLMHSVDSLRAELAGIRMTLAAYEAGLPQAREALRQLRADQVSLDSLPFQVARPVDDTTFVLNRDFVDRGLTDTIRIMSAGIGPLDDSIRPTEQKIRDMSDQLPAAHAAYPNGGTWDSIGVAAPGATQFENSGSKDKFSGDFLPDFSDYYYRVQAWTTDPAVSSLSQVVGPVQSYGQWFNTGRYPVFVAVIIFAILTVYFVSRARRGAKLYVRPLAGIEAVDDAIGRATEMGRPILYVLGLGTAADIATIASFTILGRVAKRVAEYQTSLIVPTYEPIVMSVAQEVVKSAYLDAGRPDDYDENTVFFVTNLQFAYVAAVNGIMLRQLPATNVYMGKFFAESLILAETGALAGSIQIAGTDEIAQIPFFIVACDYTLIGEELYAASAYLGREPILLGSLKAQDWAKAAVIFLALAGLVASNLDWTAFTALFHVSN
ncbi:MAG TPA: DUF6754 domain-containing protein [Acidobacteriota bacterium]|nr:DUF6754 domain-containing protein [Acidobacteriota bacterium]